MRARQALLAALIGSTVLGTVSASQAGGFALREQSAYGQGLSFAGIAAGGSLSSMFWNPATLSAVERFESEAVITGIAPGVDVDVDAPFSSDEGDIGNNALVPASYFGYRLNDRMVLGLGINGPFGLATEYDDDSLLPAFGIAGKSEIFSLNANPAVAYQLTDWLTVAVGAQIQYLSLDYTDQALPSLPPGFTASLDGNDIGFGATAGVQIKPWVGTEIGVGYRSRVDHELDGDIDLGLLGTFDATAGDFDLPDLVTVGIRQRVSDRVRVMAGAEWSNWSRFETVELETPAGTTLLSFDYEDGWFFSAGGEVDVTKKLTLRAGIGYELSPIDDDNRTFRLPDNDRLWLSAGASYTPNQRWSFDAGYTFINSEETEILADAAGGPSANGPFSGDADSHVHIISLALKRKFGVGAHTPEPLIVTK